MADVQDTQSEHSDGGVGVNGLPRHLDANMDRIQAILGSYTVQFGSAILAALVPFAYYVPATWTREQQLVKKGPATFDLGAARRDGLKMWNTNKLSTVFRGYWFTFVGALPFLQVGNRVATLLPGDNSPAMSVARDLVSDVVDTLVMQPFAVGAFRVRAAPFEAHLVGAVYDGIVFGDRPLFRTVIEKEGYIGLFKGWPITPLHQRATQFLARTITATLEERGYISSIEDAFEKDPDGAVSADVRLLGNLALIYSVCGAAAELATYPLYTISARLMTDVKGVYASPSGLLKLVKDLYAEDGVAAFYRGAVSIVPVLLSTMTFSVSLSIADRLVPSA